MSDDAIGDFLKDGDERAIAYREKIEDMMGSGDYGFAEDTLLGILDFIDKESRVTEKQCKAVDNIFNSIYGVQHEY